MEDILVVGAGPVGLVTACELARNGAQVRIIDALERPDPLSRAVIIHPRTEEALAALGVLPDFEDAGWPQTAIEIFDGREAHERVHIGTHVASRYQRMLNLPQTDTEAILTQRAHTLGLTIERGVRLVAAEQSEDGVDVELAGPTGTERLRVGWVVGADGAHSTLRDAVGTSLEGVYKGQTFVLADVATETELSTDTMRVFAHPAGIAGAFPLKHGRTRFMFQVEKSPEGQDAPTLDLVQGLINDRMQGHWRATDAYWLTYFEVHHGQVPQYRFGRILLAGDAAHIHSPAGGQGMNTGIQDATNLGWKLALVATGRADDELLDSYQDERHQVGAEVVKQTMLLTNVMASSGAAVHLRNVGLVLLGHVHALGHELASNLTEVTINYRDSTIVDGPAGRHPGAVHPGDHAPEVEGLTSPDGMPAYIGDLLQRPGLVVVVRSDDPDVRRTVQTAMGDGATVTAIVTRAAADTPNVLVDQAGLFGKTYGIDDDGLVLIRPDGYVGLMMQPIDIDLLNDYLSTALSLRLS